MTERRNGREDCKEEEDTRSACVSDTVFFFRNYSIKQVFFKESYAHGVFELFETNSTKNKIKTEFFLTIKMLKCLQFFFFGEVTSGGTLD